MWLLFLSHLRVQQSIPYDWQQERGSSLRTEVVKVSVTWMVIPKNPFAVDKHLSGQTLSCTFPCSNSALHFLNITLSPKWGRRLSGASAYGGLFFNSAILFIILTNMQVQVVQWKHLGYIPKMWSLNHQSSIGTQREPKSDLKTFKKMVVVLVSNLQLQEARNETNNIDCFRLVVMALLAQAAVCWELWARQPTRYT